MGIVSDVGGQIDIGDSRGSGGLVGEPSFELIGAWTGDWIGKLGELLVLSLDGWVGR